MFTLHTPQSTLPHSRGGTSSASTKQKHLHLLWGSVASSSRIPFRCSTAACRPAWGKPATATGLQPRAAAACPPVFLPAWARATSPRGTAACSTGREHNPILVLVSILSLHTAQPRSSDGENRRAELAADCRRVRAASGDRAAGHAAGDKQSERPERARARARGLLVLQQAPRPRRVPRR
jgi:hypothetical protein